MIMESLHAAAEVVKTEMLEEKTSRHVAVCLLRVGSACQEFTTPVLALEWQNRCALRVLILKVCKLLSRVIEIAMWLLQLLL